MREWLCKHPSLAINGAFAVGIPAWVIACKLMDLYRVGYNLRPTLALGFFIILSVGLVVFIAAIGCFLGAAGLAPRRVMTSLRLMPLVVPLVSAVAIVAAAILPSPSPARIMHRPDALVTGAFLPLIPAIMMLFAGWALAAMITALWRHRKGQPQQVVALVTADGHASDELEMNAAIRWAVRHPVWLIIVMAIFNWSIAAIILRVAYAFAQMYHTMGHAILWPSLWALPGMFFVAYMSGGLQVRHGKPIRNQITGVLPLLPVALFMALPVGDFVRGGVTVNSHWLLILGIGALAAVATGLVALAGWQLGERAQRRKESLK